VFAEFERGMIRARTRAALAAKKGRGERVSGRVPMGTQLAPVGRSLVPCPVEVEAARLAHELCAVSDHALAVHPLGPRGVPRPPATVERRAGVETDGCPGSTLAR
jgi:hypothetical protein